MNNRIIVTICFILFYILESNAQILTIDDCYKLAKANYPMIKKQELLEKSLAYDLENAATKFYPQLNITGQATYQSETVSFSGLDGVLPGNLALPSLSKDQYKLQAEISQLLYDGGANKNQKEIIQANTDLQLQNLEANLYALNNRINNLYFSILLIDAQLIQNELNKANISSQVAKTEAAYKNGVAFKSNVDELKAEMVNIDMVSTEYQANRSAYLKMLSMFIGKELDKSTQLIKPVSEAQVLTINRPELKTFDMQNAIYDLQEKGLKSTYMPQASVFVQGGYGRPTLNIVENSFGAWYMAGLRLNWSLNSLYTMSNKKNSLVLNKQMVQADKETFLLNTNLDLEQQNESVKKFMQLLLKDDEMIALRESVTKSSIAQLDNGVITTHEYIQKINSENLSKQVKILHEIQLLQARYNQKYLSNN